MALYEAVFNVMESLLPEYSAFGVVRERRRQRAAGHRAVQRLPLQRRLRADRRQRRQHLQAPDGRPSAATTSASDPTLAEQRRPRGARRRDRRRDRARGRTRARVDEVLDGARTRREVPAGRIYTAKDIAEDPHYRARDMIERQRTARRPRARRAGHRAQAARHAGRACAARRRRSASDTDAVLRELGFGDRGDRRRCAARRRGMSAIANGTGAAHLHAGSRHARRPADRDGLRADRRQDRAGQRALAKRAWRRSRSRRSSRRRRFPRCATPRVVLREIERKPGVVYSALVPNVRGAERAIESRADELNLVMSASETHNLRQPAHDARAVVRRAAPRWRSWRRGRASRSTCRCRAAFGCPMEGDVPRGRRCSTGRAASSTRWASRGVTLCDTTGMALPAQVRG